MKKLLSMFLATAVVIGLSGLAVAQVRGADRDKDETRTRRPTTTTSSPTAATSPSTTTKHSKSRAHHTSHSYHHRATTTTSTKTMPTRSNKGGAVRGTARAEEVHSMNAEKHASREGKSEGGGHGHGKSKK